MSIQVDQELLQQYFAGRCTPQQEEAVRQFLRRPEAEQLLNDVLSQNEARDLSAFENNNRIHPKNEEWKKTILERITTVPEKTTPSFLSQLFSLRYAAVWIVMLMAGFSICSIRYFSASPGPQLVWQEKSNQNGQRCMILLSDSSVVYLGAGSKLKFPEGFSARTREIYLSGEAFFEIKKNPLKPFIIHTGTVQTKVLGTSFKIEAFKNAPFSVQVSTGKVRVDEHTRKGLRSLAVLTPGQKVTFFHGETQTGTVKPEDVIAWKDARLSFSNKSLQEISAVLERWYDIKVNFKKPAKAAERLTLTLDANVPVNRIFKLLASAAHFNYTLKNKTIVIH